MYKVDKDKIQDIVKNLTSTYGFNGLYHFTNFDNLVNIFNSGFLKSRNQCEADGIEFYDGANAEIIQCTSCSVKDCVRFYYKEKTPMLYKTEGIKVNNAIPHIPIPVYLIFDKELIYLEKSIFSDGNARSEYSRFGRDYKFFSRMDWDKIFHRGILPEDVYEKMEYVRKRHAELLLKKPVPLDYLTRIAFRSEADRKRAINLFGERREYEVNKNLFNNNRNYITDYEIEVDEISRAITLHYSFNNDTYSSYKVETKIKNRFGNTIYNHKSNYNQGHGLNWYTKLNDFNHRWNKIELYMNDILCIEEFLDN